MESMSANDLPKSLEPHWKAIQRHFSGLLYIPVQQTSKERMAVRNGKIYAERLSGVRAEDIAKKYGISRNRVHKIIAQCAKQARSA